MLSLSRFAASLSSYFSLDPSKTVAMSAAIAIAADMATVFEGSKLKYDDKEAAKRLRESIYAPGGSRNANDLILEFLGRERSLAPFLKSIGIE